MNSLDLVQIHTNDFGEQYFPSINQRTFAKSSAEDVLSPFYQDYLDEEEALYIVVGSDSGLLKKYVSTHIKNPFCKFIFIESPAVLEALNIESDSYESLEDKERQLWVFDTSFEFHQLNRAFSHYVIRRRVHLIKSLAVMDAKQSSFYDELWDKLEVAYSHFMRSELNSLSAKVFEEQRFLNLAHNLIPARELENKLDGCDAIILGGGPTLDDAIEWVRDNQDKLIIFAAARIAKRMEMEGILVDFFVTVDPFPWSFDNSKALLTHSEYSILIHSFHAQHRLISQWNGLSCYLGQRYGWYEEHQKLNFDGPGPTVTNTALHIAATLGAKRLFLLGIDFCFAKGKTHESSSVEAQHKDTVAHHGKAMLEDNAGNMTETGDDFYSAKQAMESMIQHYLLHKPELKFISLGLNSAKMKNVSFQEAQTVELNGSDKVDLIEEIKVDITLTPDEKKELLQQTKKTLKSQNNRFKKINKASCEGVDLSEKVYKPSGDIVEKVAQKIKKLQKKVNHLVGRDGDYLTSYQAVLFADSFKPIADEQAMTNEEVKEQLKAFFSGLNSVSKALLDLIRQGEERIQISLNELDRKVLPSKLKPLWEKWQEQGRALQWANLYDVEKLEPKEADILQGIIQTFKNEFDKTDHQYQHMLEQNVNNVSKILARANNAYAKGNIEEINNIIEHVNDMASNNETQKSDFIALLQGMAKELSGDSVGAFNLYEPINLPSLKHIALKKMLPIAIELEDYPVAVEVLERLVKINLDYMVPYADLLKLLGNISGSIEVLQMYLKQYPDKVSVKNKLAQSLLEIEQFDDTTKILAEVLDIEPENTTANALMVKLNQMKLH